MLKTQQNTYMSVYNGNNVYQQTKTNNMKISQKLRLTMFQQALVVTLIVFLLYFIHSTLNRIESQVNSGVNSSEILKKTALSLKDFAQGTLSYQETLNVLNEHHSESTQDGNSGLQYKDIMEDIYAMQVSDEVISKRIIDKLNTSAAHSNSFINLVSERLSNSSTRSSVSQTELENINAALANTVNCLELKSLFVDLENSVENKEAFLVKLANMIEQAKVDVEALKHTAYADKPKASLKESLEIQTLAQDLIQNKEQILLLNEDLVNSANKLYGEMNKETSFLLAGGFENLKVILTWILVVLLITAFTGVYLNFTSAKLINFSFSNLGQDLSKIASGDISFSIPKGFEKRKDELGVIARAINQLLEGLGDIIQQIQEGANQLANASQQMSAGSQTLSQGANEQAASIEEVSSTLEEISANIEQNTNNAQSTESISKNAQEGIAQVAEKASAALDSTKNIADKILIINDIAFQTNILALNAAVEAARAGDHGKGFAVVAAEVRKLAERSRFAADEIVHLANQSTNLALDSAERMQLTLPEVEKTSKLVQEITAASIEQNNGAQQVNLAIQQLNNVTQQNASASEELASNAEELASQAESLLNIAAYFKLKEA